MRIFSGNPFHNARSCLQLIESISYCLRQIRTVFISLCNKHRRKTRPRKLNRLRCCTRTGFPKIPKRNKRTWFKPLYRTKNYDPYYRTNYIKTTAGCPRLHPPSSNHSRLDLVPWWRYGSSLESGANQDLFDSSTLVLNLQTNRVEHLSSKHNVLSCGHF
jgi:hypothetical protein